MSDEPQKLSEMDYKEVANVLQKMGWMVTTVDIQQDIKDGAPTNKDGTVNVVKYAGWLLSKNKIDE